MDDLAAKLQSRYALDSQGRLVSKYGRHVIGELNRKSGYRRVHVFGKKIQVHRLVWFLAHGYFPAETVDHIDGDKENNALSNLREASWLENSMYRPHAYTTTKVAGVSLCPRRKRKPFLLQLQIGGRVIRRKFATIDEAVAVRNAIWREAGIREEFIPEIPEEVRPFLDNIARDAAT